MIQRNNRNYSVTHIVGKAVVFFAVISLSSCILLTDAGTRLAYDIKDGAAKLRSSDQERLEVTHTPISILSGIKGPYEVVFQQSVDCTKCGSMWVDDINYEGKNYQPGGGTTSYHKNFVIVPHELKVNKNKGESVVVVLHKAGKDIEVESIR